MLIRLGSWINMHKLQFIMLIGCRLFRLHKSCAAEYIMGLFFCHGYIADIKFLHFQHHIVTLF